MTSHRKTHHEDSAWRPFDVAVLRAARSLGVRPRPTLYATSRALQYFAKVPSEISKFASVDMRKMLCLRYLSTYLVDVPRY